MENTAPQRSTAPSNILGAISASGTLGALALVFPPLMPFIAWIVLSGLCGVIAYAGAVIRSPYTSRILWGIAGLAVVALVAGLGIGLASPIILVTGAVQGTANWFTLFAAFVVLAIGHFLLGQGRDSDFAVAVAVLVGLAFFQAQSGLHFVTFPLVCLAMLAWYIGPARMPLLGTFAIALLVLDMANAVLPHSMRPVYGIAGNAMTWLNTTLTGVEIKTEHTGDTHWWNARATVKRICNGPRVENGQLSCMSIGPQADVPGSPRLVIVQAFKDRATITYNHRIWVAGYAETEPYKYDETQVVLMPQSDLQLSLTDPLEPSPRSEKPAQPVENKKTEPAGAPSNGPVADGKSGSPPNPSPADGSSTVQPARPEPIAQSVQPTAA